MLQDSLNYKVLSNFVWLHPRIFQLHVHSSCLLANVMCAVLLLLLATPRSEHRDGSVPKEAGNHSRDSASGVDKGSK